MKELIPVHNQGADFLVDSRDVAKAFSVKHKSLRDLIEDHEAEIRRLGVFRFEAERPLPGSSGGRPARFYWLNFDQTVYLLTITRSTEETRHFRVQLILAFKAARERFRAIDGYVLSVPDRWRKTFGDDFYKHLLKIYGAEFDASKNKPSWVGNWTNKFIYEPIYNGLSNELKLRRRAYCGSSGKDPDFIRLHQFLEETAKDQLREHVTKVLTILTVSRSKQEFAEHFIALFHGAMQLQLDDLLRAADDPCS
ncbi:MAG TPA: Rha family transcriptional regulator [Chthoniobacteraceae bacterium]|nr:Rha family transcriptional regulator [Chthoniobacteraceae bacterium]